MRYYFSITNDGVTIPDLPNIMALGHEASMEEVFTSVVAAFIEYKDRKELIPFPTYKGWGNSLNGYIVIPLVIAAKVMLHNKLITRKLGYSEFARLMGVSPTQVTRITDFRHNSRIEELERAFSAFGELLDISIIEK